MWYLKKLNSYTERVAWWVVTGAVGRRKLGDVGQRVQTSSYKFVSSGDQMYNMVTRINNIVLET